MTLSDFKTLLARAVTEHRIPDDADVCVDVYGCLCFTMPDDLAANQNKTGCVKIDVNADDVREDRLFYVRD